MFNNKRILIIRLSSIGDILHTTPVAKALKTAYPACHITWIVSKTAASLLQTNPYIDEILIWSREEFEHAALNRHVGQLKKLWIQLKTFYRRKKFDIALDIHGLFLTGAIIYASKTPQRIGMAKTRELNRFFMTEQAPPPQKNHVIYRYLSVLQPLGIHAADISMTLNIPPEANFFAERFIHEHNLSLCQPIILVNPKTSWNSKNWGNERFAKCIALMPQNAQIVLCGGPHDRSAGEYIQKLISRPVINAAGLTSLPELAALLKKAALLLTGDTGALHVAIAIGTPTISLWGPTSAEQYGPLTAGHIAITSPHACRGCHKTACRLKNNACMAAITPASVADQIKIMLAQHPSR